MGLMSGRRRRNEYGKPAPKVEAPAPKVEVKEEKPKKKVATKKVSDGSDGQAKA